MARLTPQEKKRLAYERDHVVQSEYTHLARKGRPKWKAMGSRSARRRADGLVKGLGNRPADAVLEEAETEGLTAEHIRSVRSPIRYWRHGVLTLREHVADRARKRLWSAAFDFFGKRYDPAEHRTRFANYLASLVAGSGEGSRAMAAFLANVLNPEPRHDTMDWRRRRRGDWLRAFFRDEPQWEPRLRAWMDRMLEDGE
jgi:hypothetical protein